MHHLFLMCIVVQFHMEILWNNSGFSHEVINLFVYQDIVIFIAIAWNECIISPEMRLWFEELFSLGGKYNVRTSCGCVGVFLVKQKKNKTKKHADVCIFSYCSSGKGKNIIPSIIFLSHTSKHKDSLVSFMMSRGM